MRQLIADNKPVPLVFAKMQPLCVECLKGVNFSGPKYTVARTLDHIKPLNPHDPYSTMRGRYGEPLDPENGQWLCDGHHARKSGAEHGFHKKN